MDETDVLDRDCCRGLPTVRYQPGRLHHLRRDVGHRQEYLQDDWPDGQAPRGRGHAREGQSPLPLILESTPNHGMRMLNL